MKALHYLLIAGLALASCVPATSPKSEKNEKSVETAQKVPERYKLLDIVDTVSKQYPNRYVNDIQKDRFVMHTFMEVNSRLEENDSLLAEIPVKFMQMLRHGKKYVVRFACGRYITEAHKLYSRGAQCYLGFDIFAEVSEDFAAELEEDAIYRLTGTYVSPLTLSPLKNVINVEKFKANCSKGAYNSHTLDLGGLYFKNIHVTMLEKGDK